MRRDNKAKLVWQMVATLVLVAGADFLFYGEPIGWTVGLFVELLIGAIWLSRGRPAVNPFSVVLTVLLVLLGVALIKKPGALQVGYAAVLLVVLAIATRVGWSFSVAAWMGPCFIFLLKVVIQPLRDGIALRKWRRRRPSLFFTDAWSLAWGVPILFGFCFVALFSTANPVIADWIDVAGAWLRDALDEWWLLLRPARVGLWLMVGAIVWALLRIRVSAPRRSCLTESESATVSSIDRIATTPLVTRSLLLFNLLFAVQTGLDLWYLWGGAVLPDGMTYAEYAHRGAYSLIVTALLAGAFVLITFRPGGPAEQSTVARWLVCLWGVQNLFLVVSAAWRLGLYVEVYSLTRWRVAAGGWMVVVLLGLFWLGWRIVRCRSNRWLVQVNAVTVLAILYASCFVGVDRNIAWYNAAHCEEVNGDGATIDLVYLERLGYDALPALVWLVPRLEGEKQAEAIARARRLKEALEKLLSNWRGWTWERHRIASDVGSRIRQGAEATKAPDAMVR